MATEDLHKHFCLICINKCPKSGFRYSWDTTKMYYDGTVQHFEHYPEVVNSNSKRRKYETLHYYVFEFAKKGFWSENSKYFDWRMRYQGNLKQLKLKGCF